MEDLIKSLKQPMFASRDSIEEAYEYMQMVAKATDNPMAVITACQVVVNTICNELEKIANMIEEDIDGLSSTPTPLCMAKTELESIVSGWARE